MSSVIIDFCWDIAMGNNKKYQSLGKLNKKMRNLFNSVKLPMNQSIIIISWSSLWSNLTKDIKNYKILASEPI